MHSILPLVPDSVQKPGRGYPKRGGKGPRMRQQPPDHRPDSPPHRPPSCPFRFVFPLHLRVACTAPDSSCHDPCRQRSCLKCVAHPFTAKWIHHAGGITNRDEVSRHTIVGQRSGHQAVWSVGVPAQRIFFDEETRIGAAALNRDRTTVTILKEREV